jgi:hypothetical protein
MMPTFDPWLGVVVIVYFVWLIGGFVAIVASSSRMARPHVGCLVQTLVGLGAACAWVAAFGMLAYWSIWASIAVFFAVPVAVFVWSLLMLGGSEVSAD